MRDTDPVRRAVRDLATIGALHDEALEIIRGTDNPATAQEVLRILTRAVRTVGPTARRGG